MPEASNEQRAKWGISEHRAEEYLFWHGWVMLPGWVWWHHAAVLSGDRVRMLAPGHKWREWRNEWEAICFLCDEWDFGGISLNFTKPMGKRALDGSFEPWGRADDEPLTCDSHPFEGVKND